MRQASASGSKCSASRAAGDGEECPDAFELAP